MKPTEDQHTGGEGDQLATFHSPKAPNVRFDKEYAQTYFSASVGSVLPEAPPEGRQSTCAVTRRRFSSGCEAHPATAPAGSTRSRHGGDEMSEAFG